eukprot:COSAG02_NODE_684_length_18490_cov_14.283019_16_plen_50_part_01
MDAIGGFPELERVKGLCGQMRATTGTANAAGGQAPRLLNGVSYPRPPPRP